MSTRQGNLKDYEGNKIAPNTLAVAVYDAAKDQALSQTLADTPDKSTLGFSAFSTLVDYAIGAIVYKDNKLYKFTSAHTAGAWNSEEVIEWSVKDYVDGVDSDKADKVASATAGNLAGLDASGNLTDSGVDPDDLAEKDPSAVEGNVAAFDANGNPVGTDIPANNVAQKNGYYGSLTAGAAENIVGQSAIEGTFLFRTTAGDAEVSNGVATVEQIKGNSVAFNQDWNAASTYSGSYSAGEVSRATIMLVNGPISSPIAGHKYYASVFCKGGEAGIPMTLRLLSSTASAGSTAITVGTTYTKYSIIGTASYDALNIQLFNEAFTATDNGALEAKWVNCIDLTLMFGSGNEPATVAAFESWLAANVGSKPYFPASSKLLPAKLLKLKTRGFNQMVSEPQNLVAGSFPAFDKTIYTRVFGGVKYYFRHDALDVANWRHAYKAYDLDGNEITADLFSITPQGSPYYGAGRWIDSSNSTNTGFPITFAQDCYVYFGYGVGEVTAQTEMKNACINLSWDGSRDGEYEPYVEYEYNLDVTKFYGKLNGEGDLVQIFPDGMRKADYAGTVRDLLSLKDAEADVKVGSVDLGDLDWGYSGGTFYSSSIRGLVQEPVGVDGNPNAISSKYAVMNYSSAISQDKSLTIIFASSSSHGQIWVVDSAFTDVTPFKAAAAGVYLDYELATPAHYTDLVYRDNGVDTPVEALNIIVDNWSTEEEIVAAPEASGEPNSCAATLDILYGIDAAEQLDTINQSGIFTGDLRDNLEALIGVLNTNCATALGGTLSISENPTEKVYTFTFTPTPVGE